MVAADWLKPSLILPKVSPDTPEALVRVVAQTMSAPAGVDVRHVEQAFLEVLHGEGFMIGKGVAIPHTELAQLTETSVCLVTLERPLPLKAMDGRTPDIFFFVLSKPDPRDHLLLLAHVARLAQSRTFLDGLRRARTVEQVVELVRAAELRHASPQTTVPSIAAPRSARAIFIVSVSGEQLVDALLIDLVDQGFGEASIVEAQSLSEAAAREVPLFAGFSDMFGDPGGRRILLLEDEMSRADAVVETVRRLAEEHRAEDASVSVLPLHAHWAAPKRSDERAPRGH